MEQTWHLSNLWLSVCKIPAAYEETVVAGKGWDCRWKRMLHCVDVDVLDAHRCDETALNLDVLIASDDDRPWLLGDEGWLYHSWTGCDCGYD